MIAAWIVIAVAVHVVAASAGQDWNDNLTLPGTGSTRATDLLQAKLPQQAYGSIPLALKDPNGTLGDANSKDAIDETVKNLKATPHVIRVVSPLDPNASALLSKDRTIGYISVSLNIGSAATSVEEAQAILDAADPAKAAGLDVSVGGYVGQKLSKPATESSEAIGLAAAVIILIFAFGTVTAMLLPIITAVIGLVITLALVTFVGHATDVPNISPTLATMIGLGVGIDYALFIVTKHKLQLAGGIEMHESIPRACATAGGAVVFAGITVAIALCSLFVAGIPLVTTLGYTAAIAVVVSVLAATTLLPALLAVMGERIHSLAVHAGRLASRRQEAAWLGADGARGRAAAVAGTDRQHGHPAGAGAPGPPASPGPVRHERDADLDDDPAVVRHDHRGVRGRDERAAPDRGEPEDSCAAGLQEAPAGRAAAAAAEAEAAADRRPGRGAGGDPGGRAGEGPAADAVAGGPAPGRA